MYVIVNNFNYEDLLNKLVQKLGIEDVPLTDDVIKKVFKDLESRFNINQRNELNNEEMVLVESYFKNFIGLRYSDYEETDDPDQRDKEANKDEFLMAISTEYEESLITLVSIMMTPEKERAIYSTETLEFIDKLIELYSKTETEVEDPIEGAIDYLETLVDKYISRDIEEIDLFLLKEMECALSEGERLSAIHVLDKSGRLVRYGNTLVTFPIIVIEASHSWQI